MSFFLTEEQEETLNLILDEENRKVCEEQLSSEDFPEDLKDIVRKTVEAGAPIPAFDPQVGYYTISFTPCEQGNRIYLHHHLTNVSKPIYDPIQPIIEDEIVEDDSFDDIQEPISDVSEGIVEETVEENILPEISQVHDPNIIKESPPEYTQEQIEAMFASMPEEISKVISPEKSDLEQ